MRVLVTGANRGLGLEFVRQYLERGEQVFAARRTASSELTALALRYSQQIKEVQLDLRDPESIKRTQQTVAEQTSVLDLLVNNAGIFPGRRGAVVGAEALGSLDLTTLLEVFRVNAAAPLLLAEAFLPLLNQSPNAKLANISSGYGSLTDNQNFPYSYSASKAALNQLMRSWASDPLTSKVLTLLLDPGWVRTDMGGAGAALSADTSVRGMIKVIEHAGKSEHGKFIDFQGQSANW